MAAKFPVPSKDKFLALSCINVGVGPGGTTSMLARVAIVNYHGETIVDTFVSPTMEITDYRFSTTGMIPENFNSAVQFNELQLQVAEILKNKVIVGHSIWNDLSVLGIPHPAVSTRDVALYVPFRNALRLPNQIIGLKTLTWQLMSRRIQDGHQNPLENARAAMDIYRSNATEWETAISNASWPSALPPSTFSRCYL